MGQTPHHRSSEITLAFAFWMTCLSWSSWSAAKSFSVSSVNQVCWTRIFFHRGRPRRAMNLIWGMRRSAGRQLLKSSCSNASYSPGTLVDIQRNAGSSSGSWFESQSLMKYRIVRWVLSVGAMSSKIPANCKSFLTLSASKTFSGLGTRGISVKMFMNAAGHTKIGSWRCVWYVKLSSFTHFLSLKILPTCLLNHHGMWRNKSQCSQFWISHMAESVLWQRAVCCETFDTAENIISRSLPQKDSRSIGHGHHVGRQIWPVHHKFSWNLKWWNLKFELRQLIQWSRLAAHVPRQRMYKKQWAPVASSLMPPEYVIGTCSNLGLLDDRIGGDNQGVQYYRIWNQTITD